MGSEERRVDHDAGADLKRAAEGVAGAVVETCFTARPELLARYGPAGRAKCRHDTLYHIGYLREALEAGSSALFVEYVRWVVSLLKGYDIPAGDLRLNITAIADACDTHCLPATAAGVRQIVNAGLDVLEEEPSEESLIGGEGRAALLARDYLAALLAGDRRTAGELIAAARDGGMTIKEIYLDVFTPVQREIGRLWQTNTLSVAQEHFCTAATQTIMSGFYPTMFSMPRAGRTVVAVAVGGELHEIGVRMVADLLELEGWDSYYVGANVPAASVVRTLVERHADLLAISATMTFHIDEVRAMIAAVRGSEECRDVKILVGGYPFLVEPQLWRRVGADGHAPDGRTVGEVAAKLLATR